MKLTIFEKILKTAISMNASDIHFKLDSPPVIRLNGKLLFIKDVSPLTKLDMEQISTLILTKELNEEFNQNRVYENEISFEYKDYARFRVSVFRETVGCRIVMRILNSNIPTIEQLNLPPIVNQLIENERGLILLTGATGSGKSTSIAAMINRINERHKKHIITIEDPIEYLIKNNKSIITQREVGIHCKSYTSALKSSLRQDPDVIMIGEIRDYETMMGTITAAETGHLILSTLHTIDARESINRILSLVPENQLNQIRRQVASVLIAIISLRLIPRADGKGRVPAVEVLVNNSRVTELIENPQRTKEIYDAIEESQVTFGMQTFDQSLIKLINEGYISIQDALRYCSERNNFILKLKGIYKKETETLGKMKEMVFDDSVIKSIKMENE